MRYHKISIITPTFNQGNFIEETINSVLDQNYPKLEYIIIDGGSTDNTTEIIKKYEKHLSFWVSEIDNGQTHAINKGLNHSSGEIINWLNSDDYYNPGVLHKVNTYFQDPTINAVLGCSHIFEHQGTSRQISKGGHLYESIERTIGDSLLDQPSAFFRSEIFKSLSPLDENLKYLMDRAFWIKYLLYYGQKNIEKVNDVFVNFRLHDNSKSVAEIRGFNYERNSIYRAMFNKFEIKNLNPFFRKEIPTEIIKLNWPDLKILDVDFDSITAEFISVLAQESYAKNEFKRAKTLIQYIDLNKLESGSKRKLKKIDSKLRLPENLISWVKRLKK